MILLLYALIGKVLAIGVGIYTFGRLSIPFKLTLILTFVAFVAECVGYYVSHYLHSQNVWLFNLYMLIEVWLAGATAILLLNNKKIKVLFAGLMLVHFAFWIVSIQRNGLFTFASNAMIFGCFELVLFYIIVLFSNSLFSAGGLFNQPIFWICLATILYFGCDIPVMGLYNFLAEKMPQVGGKLANINTYLDIIRYPLYGVSFLLLGRAKQKLPAVA